MNELQVVFGATGALGSAVVRGLVAQGKPVLAVVRKEDKAERFLPEDTEYSVADALDPDHVKFLCADAAVIYNCVHTRGDGWFSLTENLLSAARQSGARLVYPSNIHGYGPLQRTPATEDHPRLATSKRGVLRNAIEKMLLDARDAGDVQVCIPRLAGLYGPGVLESFLAQITEVALIGKTAYWYGKLDVPYDLVYVEDAAAACILLGNTAELAEAENPVWHVPGPEPLTGRQFIELTFKTAGRKPSMGVRSRLMIQAIGALTPAAKELAEVMYEFETPTLMDGSKLQATFPQFRYTPHQTGVQQAVEWMREYRSEQTAGQAPEPSAAAAEPVERE